MQQPYFVFSVDLLAQIINAITDNKQNYLHFFFGFHVGKPDNIILSLL